MRLSPARYLLLGLLAASCNCEQEPGAGDAGSTDIRGADAETDTGSDAGDANPRCGSGEVEEVELAGWTISIDHPRGAWTATPPGATSPALASPAICEGETAIRLLDEPATARHAFGNFDIDLTGDNTWLGNNAVPLQVDRSAGLAITYDADAHQATLRFSEGSKGGLRIELEHAVESAEFRLDCATDEAFFGLGTQVTGMDLRGRTYPLWTQEQGNSKPEGGGSFPLNNTPEAAYAPMGVLHSTAGYSGVVTHDGYTEVDLCNSDTDRVAIRSHKANPGFVFVSGSPKERMTAVTEYTGRVRTDVPDWVFGLWVDSVTGPERLERVTSTLRDNDIPASAIWSEDWIGGASSMFGFRLSYDWVWDQNQYPNLPALIDDLHVRGFAFLTYFNTFLVAGTSVFPQAEAEGYFVEDADGEPFLFTDPAFRRAGLVDLFNPAAVDWLKAYQMTAVTELGIDGWMADFSEWYPLEAPDAWEQHNVYPLQWQRVNEAHMREARPDGNYAYFPRSGWASVNGGTGGVAPVMWGGDQNTNWAYDDGFPTIVPIGAHVGLAGVAIFGSDIAGYNSIGNIPNTTKELWFRWAATAAFHPLMRTHHGGDECANWNFDRDRETLDHTKRWSSVHSHLLPEFQRLYAQASAQGWPISRHPWLVEPDQAALWKGDQYAWFLGDDLFVNPVLTERATTRDVVLPGEWWPLFGDAPVRSAMLSVDAAVTEVPVFVRPGRALTLLADPVESFRGANDGETTDLADTANRYRVALYPDGAGAAATPEDSPFALQASSLDGFDTTTVQLDGDDLPACTGPVISSCVAGELVWLVDVIGSTVTAGAATVTVTSLTPVTVAIGVGATAWGELAVPTSYAPNPDAPSWCPPEEQ